MKGNHSLHLATRSLNPGQPHQKPGKRAKTPEIHHNFIIVGLRFMDLASGPEDRAFRG